MLVQGCDCSVVILVNDRRFVVPYSEETIRENATLLLEEAAIEGDGRQRAIRQVTGVAGCVVTPLTLANTPLLFALVLGEAGIPVFVSETRNLFRHTIRLVPAESSPLFEVRQERGREGKRYENCKVTGFELRVMRDANTDTSAIKLRIDITSEFAPGSYPVIETAELVIGERFKEDNLGYAINGNAVNGIYGFSIVTKKQAGTKTEVWIHRILGSEELPAIVGSFTVTARLLNDGYEERHFGEFQLAFTNLVLMADETTVNSARAVIGPLRYYCAGDFSAEVFTNNEVVLL
jgi:hypothetical protein